MKFIPNYRVCYNGRFYEAGSPFPIRDEDAGTMQRHGTVLHEPAPPPAAPRKAGRPRKVNHGESGKAETAHQ